MPDSECVTAYCPLCGSSNVSPDANSAGRNVCLSCGHIGAVASFHRPENAALARKAVEPTTAIQALAAEPVHTANPHYWWQDY